MSKFEIRAGVFYVVVFTLVLCSQTFAQSAVPESGFLDDYSKLKPAPEGVPGFIFEVESGEAGMAILGSYDSLMVDQPAIVLAPDSKKGLKPDEQKLIADAYRMALITALERGERRLVTSPGPNTLYFRPGLTNLYLKKKRVKLVQFTPIGLVATVATSPFRDVMDKVNLLEATFEAELIDSQTGKVLGAVVVPAGMHDSKKDQTSWKEFDALLNATATRLGCRLNNSKRTPDQRVDCFAQ